MDEEQLIADDAGLASVRVGDVSTFSMQHGAGQGQSGTQQGTAHPPLPSRLVACVNLIVAHSDADLVRRSQRAMVTLRAIVAGRERAVSLPNICD